MTTLREAALAYARQGWPVFPCKPRGKTPLTPTGFKDATCNENMLERWWDRWPDANIGVPTGTPIKAWVLDVDGAEGSVSLTQLETQLGVELPLTREAITGGGGRHLFFTMPGDRTVGNRVNVLPGLDVRGEGGYVVVPPSIHPSGKAYAWLA